MLRLATFIAALLTVLVWFAMTADATTVTPIGKPLPFVKRVDMVGCGQKVAVSIPVGRYVIFVNAGTVARSVDSQQVPTPRWPLKRGGWMESKASGPQTFTVLEKHTGCAKTSVFTVKVV